MFVVTREDKPGRCGSSSLFDFRTHFSSRRHRRLSLTPSPYSPPCFFPHSLQALHQPFSLSPAHILISLAAPQRATPPRRSVGDPLPLHGRRRRPLDSEASWGHHPRAPPPSAGPGSGPRLPPAAGPGWPAGRHRGRFRRPIRLTRPGPLGQDVDGRAARAAVRAAGPGPPAPSAAALRVRFAQVAADAALPCTPRACAAPGFGARPSGSAGAADWLSGLLL